MQGRNDFYCLLYLRVSRTSLLYTKTPVNYIVKAERLGAGRFNREFRPQGHSGYWRKLENSMTLLHTNLYGDVSSAPPAMDSYILG